MNGLGGEGSLGEWARDLLNMSETISNSVSAAAIFSALESCGRPPNRKDMLKIWGSRAVRCELA